MIDSCKNCKYCVCDGADELRCHYNAPSPMTLLSEDYGNVVIAKFPMVGPSDFCSYGEESWRKINEEIF